MAGKRKGIVARALAWLKPGGTAPDVERGRPQAPPGSDDPAYRPAAFPGILARTMADWPFAARETQSEAARDQEDIDRLRGYAKAWRETPRAAGRLGLPHVTDGEIDAEQERRRREAEAGRDARRQGRAQHSTE